MPSMLSFVLVALLTPSAAVAYETCAGRKDGTYCVGPPIPLLGLNHTILHCPNGQRETCSSGYYCGEATGLKPDQQRCELMDASMAVVADKINIPTKQIAPGVHMPIVNIGTWTSGSTKKENASAIVGNWLS